MSEAHGPSMRTVENRLPVILQNEIAECGLACLAMIASYHGYQVGLNNLRAEFPVSLRGTNLKQLIEIADKLNLSARAVKLELDELALLDKPAILHWDMNHFVVLKAVKGSQVTVIDPGRGEVTLSLEEVDKHFTGIALELKKSEGFQAGVNHERLSFLDLFRHVRGLKSFFIQLFCLSVALQLFAMLSPFYMQTVIDEVVVSSDKELLLLLASAFLLLGVFEAFIKAIRSYVVLNISNQLSFHMTSRLFRHLLRLPVDFFEKRHIGDVTSRFESLDSVRELLTGSLVESVVDGFMVVATLSMMFIYSPPLAWIAIVAFVLYLLLRLAVYPMLRRRTEEGIVAGAREDSTFLETVRAIQSIKLFGKEADRQSVWSNNLVSALNASIRLEKIKINYDAVNGVIAAVETIAIVYVGALLVMEESLTIGMLLAFVAYQRQFSEKSDNLVDQFIEIRMLGLHLERLSDIAITPPEANMTGSLALNGPLSGDLSLQQLSYRYANEKADVFSDISLEVKAGEFIAITGPSGCGKTTLLKVMIGLFEASSGKVLLDGIDLQKIGLREFRKRIAVVMQDDHLLSGSIAENIAYFSAQPDKALIEDCARLAGIHDEIMAMPMAYNSLVGDMGNTLSGGQKQRIILARALYHKPDILFMDEGTSHLDTRLESQLNERIRALNITRIVIAHRPASVNCADRVLVMDRDGLREQRPAVD